MTVEKQFEGKNVATAVKNACKHLNVAEEELKYEVLSHGSSGIFGIVGVKKARISVLLNEPAPHDGEPEAAPEEKANSASGDEKGGQAGRKENPADRISPDTGRIDKSNEGLSVGPAGEAEANTPDAAMELGKMVLQKIVDTIAEEARIRVEKKKNTIFYNIDCVESGPLIGKRGYTLDAMQYLLERILSGKVDVKTRVRVDVCGYRSKRKAQILKLAANAAKKVHQNGKPTPLGLFNPEEIKILQASMKRQSVVCRASKGEGYLKKMILFPPKPHPQAPEAGTAQDPT